MQEFGKRAAERLDGLSARLLDASYRPSPGRRIHLPEAPDRPIAVATVEDRVVQRAVADVLGQLLEPRFSACAWGYRPGRSVRDAVAAVEHHLALGRRWFARSDIESFFEAIDRSRLAERLAAAGVASDVMSLIRKLLQAGVVDGASAFDTGEGVAQGSALSPLLSNLYLDPVDRVMEQAGYPYLRYADDLLVLAADEAGAVDGLDVLSQAVRAEGLRLGARKTRRGHLGAGFVFLGVTFDPGGRRLSSRAWKALDAVAAERVSDPEALEEVAAEWERWYGRLPLVGIERLPTLAAAALRADRVDDALQVDALAAARATIDAPRLSGALHLALCGVWSRSAAPAAARALVVDAAAAVRAGLDADQRDVLSHLLGIPAEELPVLAGPLPEAGTRLAALGAVALGDAARAGAARLVRAGIPRARAPVDGAVLDWLLARARGRDGIHALEQRDRRGHLRLLDQPQPLTREVVEAHLAGRHRVGCYFVRPDGMVLLAQVRVSVRREAMVPPWALGEGGFTPGARERWRSLEGSAHDYAVALSRAGEAAGARLWVEDDGGHGRNTWLFLAGPVQLRHARAFLVRVVGDAGDPPPELHVEIVPSSDRVRRGPGPAVVLPLGVHPRSGAAGRFVDAAGRPLPSPPDDDLAPPEAITAITRRGPLAPGLPRGVPVEGPRARQVLAGCAVVRSLAEKAERLRHLAGDERRTLVEALGHLPDDERTTTLEHLLGPLGYGRHQVERSLAHLGDQPVSCHKIRARHPALTTEVSCDCRFRGLRSGAYPTPVLHALRPEQVPALRARMQARNETEGAPRPAMTTPPSPPPPPDPPSPGSPPTNADVVWGRYRNLERQLEDARRGLRRVHAMLHRMLDEGDGRVRVDGGWLVRRRTPKGARFEFEEEDP